VEQTHENPLYDWGKKLTTASTIMLFVTPN